MKKALTISAVILFAMLAAWSICDVCNHIENLNSYVEWSSKYDTKEEFSYYNKLYIFYSVAAVLEAVSYLLYAIAVYLKSTKSAVCASGTALICVAAQAVFNSILVNLADKANIYSGVEPVEPLEIIIPMFTYIAVIMFMIIHGKIDNAPVKAVVATIPAAFCTGIAVFYIMDGISLYKEYTYDEPSVRYFLIMVLAQIVYWLLVVLAYLLLTHSFAFGKKASKVNSLNPIRKYDSNLPLSLHPMQNGTCVSEKPKISLREELKEYQQLYTEQLITDSEYEAKRKQLLGL